MRTKIIEDDISKESWWCKHDLNWSWSESWSMRECKPNAWESVKQIECMSECKSQIDQKPQKQGLKRKSDWKRWDTSD